MYTSLVFLAIRVRNVTRRRARIERIFSLIMYWDKNFCDFLVFGWVPFVCCLYLYTCICIILNYQFEMEIENLNVFSFSNLSPKIQSEDFRKGILSYFPNSLPFSPNIDETMVLLAPRQCFKVFCCTLLTSNYWIRFKFVDMQSNFDFQSLFQNHHGF